MKKFYLILKILLVLAALIALAYLITPPDDEIIIKKPWLNPQDGMPVDVLENYNWNDAEDKKAYAKADWNKITAPRLEGFSAAWPLVKFVEKKTEGCRLEGDEADYLRVEGGLCRRGYWLELTLKNETLEDVNRVSTLAELEKSFTPIKNETQAMSFVAVAKSGLKVGAGDILDGQTLTIPGRFLGRGAFLVQVFKANAFGCSNHEPTGVIYKVENGGEITEIAFKPESPSTDENFFCAD